MIEHDVKARFAVDTLHHELTVLKDDGMYRHLRMKPPAGEPSEYWYDVITWPGSLAVRGDCGAELIFSRDTDMLQFFRRRPGDDAINPQYWGGKTATGVPREYSENALRARLVEEFVGVARDRGVPRGTGAALRELLREDLSDHREAMSLVAGFNHGFHYSAQCPCGERKETADFLHLAMWKSNHVRHGSLTVREHEGFSFDDADEWDVSEYPQDFLWSCHAIVKAIAAYDARGPVASPQGGVYGAVMHVAAQAVRTADDTPVGDAVRRLALKVSAAADGAMGFRR